MEESILESTSRIRRNQPADQMDYYKRTKEERLRQLNTNGKRGDHSGSNSKRNADNDEFDEEINIEDVNFNIVGVQQNEGDRMGPP